MSYTIIEDIGNKKDKHKAKHKYFMEQGINLRREALPIGDYILCTETVQNVINRKEKRGVALKKMDFMGAFKITVDTKKDIQEIILNICGKQHGRFRDECLLATNNQVKLYILIENKDNIQNLNDLENWINPRIAKYEKILEMHQKGKWKHISEPKSPPTSGKTLAKAMRSMEEKYDVKFVFCDPSEAGEKIVELLSGRENDS